MKTLNITTLLFLIVILASCKKSKPDAGSSYPKLVSIIYKVSSNTVSSAAIVQYRNEIDVVTDVPNSNLPFTKSFTRSVNKNDVLSLGYGTNTNQTVKLDILVNNVLVKSQTFTQTAGAITYLFE